MTGKVVSYGQFGDISEGPQSHPWEDTGHEWLDVRMNASLQDRAFGNEAAQKRRMELGNVPRLTGEPDILPHMEGDKMGGRKTGLSKSMDVQRRDSNQKERFGLNYRVTDNDAKPETLGGPAPTLEPVSHVFRGMSEDDFQQSQAQGFIRSDGRGAIDPEWEGTNAGIDMATAQTYMPHSGLGRVVKIAVHPEDQDKWFTSQHDSYARTREPIPWDRVTAHTSAFDKSLGSQFRDSVVEQQKREGR